MRVAFGTFLGLPEPATFMGDAAYVRSRWTACPEAAFAAEVDGRLVGSNFATRWGSFGFFGPLTLDPALWGRSVAGRLMEPVVERFEAWGVTHAGLFTFAHSPKHIGLYQKYGFRPRSLTLLLEKSVGPTEVPPEGWQAYSRLSEGGRREALASCRRLTDGIYPGLDVTPEIEAMERQSLGETVLVGEGERVGVAACHSGPGSEAGSGACYIKFGAAAPGPGARRHFGRLLRACEAFAAGAGATRLTAGVNAARREAYEEMLAAGFRIAHTGIAMHRPNEPGFSRQGAFVIDDWR